MSPLYLFWLFLKASLFSSGGTANLPSLYADLTSIHVANQREFAESLAIGQIAPGPNGLWVISLGYFVSGMLGSLLALTAILIPPLLILFVERFYRRVQEHVVVERLVRGVSLSVVGIFAIVLARMFSLNRFPGMSAGILLASMAVGATKRVPITLIFGASAILGILFMR